MYELALTKSFDPFFSLFAIVHTLQNSQMYHEKPYRPTSQTAKSQNYYQICVFSFNFFTVRENEGTHIGLVS